MSSGMELFRVVGKGIWIALVFSIGSHLEEVASVLESWHQLISEIATTMLSSRVCLRC